MDNDNIIKKRIVKAYRSIRLRFDYVSMGLVSEIKGNELIKQLLKSNEPFMVGRFGAVEMRCVNRWMNKQNYTKWERDQALYAAGIFPNNQETLDLFSEIYSKSMKSCNVLGVWEVVGEKRAIKKYCPGVSLIPSRSIEPYYFEYPWSSALEGKKVLVIHPFVESIEKQLSNRKAIWPEKDVLPKFKSITYIKAIQSNAGGETEFVNWIEALESMKREIDKVDFDIAIIGAGAYGFPLAAYIKEKDKQAIQMSGATQILFGIKGKRWDNHPVISKFYNEAWIRPDILETPPLAKKVEGGSYW